MVTLKQVERHDPNFLKDFDFLSEFCQQTEVNNLSVEEDIVRLKDYLGI